MVLAQSKYSVLGFVACCMSGPNVSENRLSADKPTTENVVAETRSLELTPIDRQTEELRTPESISVNFQGYVGKPDLGQAIDRQQRLLREQLHTLVSETETIDSSQAAILSRIVNDKVNYLQSRIQDTRVSALVLQRDGDSSWTQLEGAANYIEQSLLEALESIPVDSLVDEAEPFSEKLDSLLHSLTLHSARVDATPSSAPKFRENLKDELEKIFAELGIELPTEDPEQTQSLLERHREVLRDQLSSSQDEIDRRRGEMRNQIENLNEQTRTHEYGLLDTFTGRYDIENAGDQSQIAHIGKRAAELQALQQQAGALQGQVGSVDAVLSVLRADRAVAEGQHQQAARLLANLQEGTTKAALGESASLTNLVHEATNYLRENGALLPHEESLYTDTDTFTRIESALQSVDEIPTRERSQADIHQQVLQRETFETLQSGKAHTLFRQTPRFNGSPQTQILELEFKQLSLRGSGVNGAQFTLLFTKEASAAWNAIPDGSQPVLLKPAIHLQQRTTGSGRGGSITEFTNDPARSTIAASEVGYLRNGIVYDASGKEVELQNHPHRAWIERQVEQSRSFSTLSYRPPAELRQRDTGSGTSIPIQDELFTIRTQNGASIQGIKISPEVRQILAEPPPDGMTLVLQRIPESIRLGGIQKEHVTHGRSSRVQTWVQTVSPADELRLEDLGYARVTNGAVEIQSIVDSRTSLQASAQISVSRSDAVPVSDILPGTITFEGRKQDYLSQHSARRVQFRGGEHDSRSYTLLFTRDADTAWSRIPAEAQPVILRPVANPDSTIRRAARGGATTTTLRNAPYDFLLQSSDIGYFKEGVLYNSDGKAIELATHEHAGWIRGQIDHARSVSVRPVQFRTPLVGIDGNVSSETLYQVQTPDGRKIDGVRVTAEALEALRREQPLGTSIVLKHLPERISLGKPFTRDGQEMRQILREPQTITIDDLALSTSGPRGFTLTNLSSSAPSTETIASAPLQHLERTTTDGLLRALAEDKDIAQMNSASLSMYQTLSHLQSSLQAHGVGSSREAFVEFVRSEAKPMHEFINSPETVALAGRLEAQLANLKQLQRGAADGPTEAALRQQIQAIEQFISVVREPRIKHVLDTLMDTSKFGPDSWSNWSTHELPIVAGAVAGAVAGTAAVVFTAGAAGVVVVPLWAMAAGGAVGGLIGSELTREGLFAYHQAYGDAADGTATYRDRSLLLTKLNETAVFNPETGQFEQVSWGQVAGDYSFQLARNFALTYTTMLGSQYFSAQLSQILQRSSFLERVAANSDIVKGLLRHMSQAQSRTLSAVEQQQFRAAFQRAAINFGRNYAEEMSDEAQEELVQQFFTEVAGDLGITGKTGAEGSLAALVLGTIKGTRTSSGTIGYNPQASGTDSINSMLEQAQAQGMTVHNLGRGVYTILNSSTSQRIVIRPYSSSDLAALERQNSPSSELPGAQSEAETSVAPSVEQSTALPKNSSEFIEERVNHFNLRQQFFAARLTELQIKHPTDWQSRIDSALEHERQILLESAQAAFTAQGVEVEPVHGPDGQLRSLRILPVRGAGELNTYAARIGRSRGVTLEYDPALLASRSAGALFDTELKRVLLPHDVVRLGINSQLLYHEKIHAVFESIRAQGGDSLFFGEVELGSGTVSLDEYATYSELLARHLVAANNPALPEVERERSLVQAREHAEILAGFNSEIKELLAQLSPTVLSEARIVPQIRPRNNGKPQVGLVAEVLVGERVLRFDLASAPSVDQLPDDASARQRLAEKVTLLTQLTRSTETLTASTIDSLLSDEPQATQQALSQAQSLRALVAEQYLLSPSASHQQTDTIRLPRVPQSPQLESGRMVASHESSTDYGFSSLLEAAIAETSVERETAVISRPERSPLNRSVRITQGSEPFEVSIEGEKIVLRFDNGSTTETRSKLTPAQIDVLLTELTRRANMFGGRISNNLESLAESIRTAKLHASFYGRDQSPPEAAAALKQFLVDNQFPATSIRITPGMTSQERIAGYARLAEAGTALTEALQPRYKGEQVNEVVFNALKARIEEHYGKALLDQVLQRDSTQGQPSLDELLNRLEAADAERVRPVNFTLEGPLLHDNEGNRATYHFSIERRHDGSIIIEQLSPSGMGRSPIVSLEGFIQRLERATTLPGQRRGEWRSYTQLSALPFSQPRDSSTTNSARYRASHEGSGVETDLLTRLVHYLEGNQPTLTKPQETQLYWDLVGTDTLSLVDSEEALNQLRSAAYDDLQEWIELEPGASLQERAVLATRLEHFGLGEAVHATQLERIRSAASNITLAERFNTDPDSLAQAELLDLHRVFLSEETRTPLRDFASLEKRVQQTQERMLAMLVGKEEMSLARQLSLAQSLRVTERFAEQSPEIQQQLIAVEQFSTIVASIARGETLEAGEILRFRDAFTSFASEDFSLLSEVDIRSHAQGDLLLGTAQDWQQFSVAALQQKLDSGRELSVAEVRALAEISQQRNSAGTVVFNIPQEHPSYQAIQREISIQALALRIGAKPASLNHENLQKLITEVATTLQLSETVATELLFHLTRYSEVGGRRDETREIANQRQQNRSREFHDVPVEGLLSLQTMLGDAGLVRFGVGNPDLMLYAPGTGSVTDQLLYLLNGRSLGGTGTSSGRTTRPFAEHTSTDISKSSMAIVDDVFMHRMRNDTQFRRAVASSNVRLVISPELVGGIPLGSLSVTNSESTIRDRLLNLGSAYQARADANQASELDQTLLSALLSQEIESELRQLIQSESRTEDSAQPSIQVLSLNRLTSPTIDSVRSQLNGTRNDASPAELSDIIRNGLGQLNIELSPEEETLFIRSLEQSALVLDNRHIAEALRSLHSQIQANAEQIVSGMQHSTPMSAEVYYVVPADEKSFQHVAALYRQANQVDPARFITPEEIPKLRKALRQDGKFLIPVILDDLAASGGTLLKMSLVAADGVPFVGRPDLRDVKEYARLRREALENRSNPNARFEIPTPLARRLFGEERARPGQLPNPSRTNERPVIVAAIAATEHGRTVFEGNPISERSSFISVIPVSSVQQTEAWQQLSQLPGMTAARMAQLVDAMNLSMPVYDPQGQVTLVQFPHGDSNTNIRWWQETIAPELMLSPAAIRLYVSPRFAP